MIFAHLFAVFHRFCAWLTVNYMYLSIYFFRAHSKPNSEPKTIKTTTKITEIPKSTIKELPKPVPKPKPSKPKPALPFSYSTLTSLYSKYSKTDEMEPDAIERLCSDLDIHIESPQVLLLAYKLNAANMGVFSRDEFIQGCTAMQADTIEKLQEKIDKNVNSDELKGFYTWLFKWAKDDSCRGLDVSVSFFTLYNICN